MPQTTVVFVHGFTSSPICWKPFTDRLKKDDQFPSETYTFVTFPYPTEFFQWNPKKRIASINDCGSNLALFLDTQYKTGALILVGHSMGGLVIQSMLAQKIQSHCGKDLARIREVVLFATPNRGSMIFNDARSFFSRLRENPQEEDLKVLNPDIARNSEVIEASILGASAVTNDSCPIPFRVFWGSQDNVVSEVSARGPFVEASCLPGGHSEIIDCDPTDPKHPNNTNDPGYQRYAALTDAILNPVGHPSVYEIDLLEVVLTISPVSPDTTFTIPRLDNPKPIHTDNIATRLMKFNFSPGNRCRIPFEKDYRSDDGFVEPLNITEPNEASAADQSEYSSAGKKFTYLFTPDKGETYLMKLRIYNGFGEGQRQWHDHVKPNANHKRIRITLDLTAYGNAGFQIDPAPSFHYRTQDAMDSTLRADRDSGSLQSPQPSVGPCLYTWELTDVKGGAVDLIWDLKPKES